MADPKIYAYLRILGFECRPDEISAHLGVEPSRSWVKGEIVPPRRRPSDESGWELRSPLDEPYDLEDHALWLLDRLPSRIDLSGLTAWWTVTLSFAVYLRGRTPAGFFENGTLARIAALGAALDIDLYVLPHDEPADGE